jgi:hypothetical protein
LSYLFIYYLFICLLFKGGYGTRLGMNQAYHALQTPYFQQQMSHFASQQPFGTQFTNFVAQAYGNPSTGQPPIVSNNSVSQPQNLAYAAQPIFSQFNGTVNSANTT